MADAYSSLLEAFKNVGVARAYGAPVRLDDGEEFVPVALVSFGFGGGTDAEPDGGGAAGGGGGGAVLPLGVYRRGRGGSPVFRPNTIALLAGLVPVVCAAGLAVRGALRALRS
jgi:hypothetical protein